MRLLHTADWLVELVVAKQIDAVSLRRQTVAIRKPKAPIEGIGPSRHLP